MKGSLKKILGPVILLATVASFVWYAKRHPEILQQIKALPLDTIVVLIALYGVILFALILVTRASLQLYKKHMGAQENLLFNAYSLLINFFGPGQSGPIFRGVYLKKRHDLGVKPYMFTLLIYYGFYAVISVMCMFVGTWPVWQTGLVMLVVAGVSWQVIRYYKKRSKIGDLSGFSVTTIGWIFAAALLQVICLAVIYGFELHRVGADVSIGQILSYTGVANFALFVALTPGAIGIREGFLLFSQNLHHIDSSTVIAASVIDRAVYLLFLGLLFVLVLGLHAKRKLGISNS